MKLYLLYIVDTVFCDVCGLILIQLNHNFYIITLQNILCALSRYKYSDNYLLTSIFYLKYRFK